MDNGQSRGIELAEGGRAGPIPGVLAIDFGSTFTRGIILLTMAPSRGEMVVIEVPIDDWDATFNVLYNRGEFPSSGCPFEDGLTVGSDAYRKPERCSLKYFIYILANVNKDAVLQHYPHFGQLAKKKASRVFRRKLKNLLVKFFLQLKARINSICEERNLYFREIALSIPVQWDNPFQDAYEKIILKVFDQITPESIHWIFEPEAITHYLLSKQKDRIYPYKHLLIFDFGGHSMNRIHAQANWDKNKNVAFFEDMGAFSAPGGSELWSYLFGEHIAKQLQGQGMQAAESECWLKMISNFVGEKQKLDPLNENKEWKMTWEDDTNNQWKVRVSAEDMKRLFEKAFETVLEQYEKQMTLSGLHRQPEELCVIFSGGTLLNRSLKSHLADRTRSRAGRVVFAHEFQTLYSTYSIAYGAALALANRITVREFYDRGAAFGLQQGTVDISDGSVSWQNGADLLLDNERSYTRGIDLDRECELRITCDPFFGSHRGKDLIFKNSYDFIQLRSRQPGTYTFDLTRESKEGKDYLLLREKHYNPGHIASPVLLRRFQVFYDPGGCLVLQQPENKKPIREKRQRKRRRVSAGEGQSKNIKLELLGQRNEEHIAGD